MIPLPRPAASSGGSGEFAGASHAVSVREGYARWAATYDHDANPLLALEQRQLCRMLPRLEGRRVLDLGCGTGRWMERLRREGARSVVGADFSTAMLAVANQKPSLAGCLVTAEGEALPFRDAWFNLVVCSFVTGHLREVRPAARELARVCASGADVFASDLHPQAHAWGWRTGFRDKQGKVEIATWPHTVQELHDAWVSSGFDCLRTVECRFSEAEKPIFARAGKAHIFEPACSVPAVLLWHLRRVS